MTSKSSNKLEKPDGRNSGIKNYRFRPKTEREIIDIYILLTLARGLCEYHLILICQILGLLAKILALGLTLKVFNPKIRIIAP